ncbi:AtpZ/AtpI family protein [Paenibacillus sp. HB172176]|uniref:AtpZ/AtpI family protein n=1 Tax=Paenibacillus sp. HB172176 TaxID=2493690 RepID=UPI00143C897A|nr:AtpZ/AtpI family protein [Paenibacillus sp. HB172176]
MDPSNNQPSKEHNNEDNRTFGDDPWRAMGLVGAVGVDLAVCLWLGYWLGTKADHAGGTDYYSIIGLIAGLIVGVVTVIFLIRTFSGGKAK